MTNLYPSGIRHHFSPDGKSLSTISDEPVDYILLADFVENERNRGTLELWDLTIINGHHMPYFGPYTAYFNFKTMIWTAAAIYNDGTHKLGTSSFGFINKFEILRVLRCFSTRNIETNLRALAVEQKVA